MKHLKGYDRYNEAWFDFFKKSRKVDKSTPIVGNNDYDPIVENILKRVDEIFDIDRLSMNYGDNGEEDDPTISYDNYIYELEETDSDKGFIKIKSQETFYNKKRFYLYLDDKHIKCSELVAKKFWEFFDKKWREKIQLQRDERNKSEFNNFKKKYGHL